MIFAANASWMKVHDYISSANYKPDGDHAPTADPGQDKLIGMGPASDSRGMNAEHSDSLLKLHNDEEDVKV